MCVGGGGVLNVMVNAVCVCVWGGVLNVMVNAVCVCVGGGA